MVRKIFLLIFIWLIIGQGCSEEVKMNDQEKLIKAYSMYDEFKDEFKTVVPITTEEVKSIKTPITLIDVREENEQDISMIPGAITKIEFEKNKDKYKDTLLITYCTIGYRSGLYAAELIKNGYSVKNLKGSLLAWVLSGEPVQKNGKEILIVHVYGKKWNLLPTKYKAIW